MNVEFEIPWITEPVLVHTKDGMGVYPAEVTIEFVYAGRIYVVGVVYGAEAVERRCPAIKFAEQMVCLLWAGHDGPHIPCTEQLQQTVGNFTFVSMRRAATL